MDFELSPEQEQLRDNVVRLMKDRYGFEARKTYRAAREGWSKAFAKFRLRRRPRRWRSSPTFRPSSCAAPS